MDVSDITLQMVQWSNRGAGGSRVGGRYLVGPLISVSWCSFDIVVVQWCSPAQSLTEPPVFSLTFLTVVIILVAVCFLSDSYFLYYVVLMACLAFSLDNPLASEVAWSILGLSVPIRSSLLCLFLPHTHTHTCTHWPTHTPFRFSLCKSSVL